MRTILWLIIIMAATATEVAMYQKLPALGLENRQVLRAEEFQGLTVRDRGGEAVGEVKSVLIDPELGTAEYLLVEEPGGDERLVPFRGVELRNGAFYLGVGENAFDRSPLHSAPRLGEPGYLDEVNEHFGAGH